MRNRDTSYMISKNEENLLYRIQQYSITPKLCKYCQKPLPYKNHNHKSFCNQSCAASYNNQKYQKRIAAIKRCKFCNEELPFEKRYRTFCNLSCAAAFNKHGQRRIGTPNYCKQCGNKIHWKLIFCSDECRVLFKDNEFIKDIRLKMKNHDPIRHTSVKLYLLKTRDHKCEKCKNILWNNLSISLETHHIDGNYNNNEEQNIILLCPNCHSQTDNYRIKNKGNGRPYRKW